MSKKKVMLTIDEELYSEFKVYALKKFRDTRNFVSKALEEAMRRWLEEERRLEQQLKGG